MSYSGYIPILFEWTLAGTCDCNTRGLIQEARGTVAMATRRDMASRGLVWSVCLLHLLPSVRGQCECNSYRSLSVAGNYVLPASLCFLSCLSIPASLCPSVYHCVDFPVCLYSFVCDPFLF